MKAGKIALYGALLLTIIISSLFSENMELLWRFVTGGAIRGRPAINSTGTVYLLSEDRYLYAVDENGSLKWKFYLSSRPWDSLSIGIDGTIYTGSKTGTLTAVSSYGNEIWEFSFNGFPTGDPVTAPDGSIYFGTTEGVVYSLSHTGRLKWSISLPGAVSASLIMSRNVIYVPSSVNKLFALTSLGEIKWEFLLAGIPDTPAADENGNIYITTDSGTLAAIDSNGVLIWNYSEGTPLLSPLLGIRGIYSVSSSGYFIQLDYDGNLICKSITKTSFSGSAVSEDELLYFQVESGYIYHTDPEGNLIERIKTSKGAGTPVLTINGKLYTSGSDWVLYAYSAKEPGITGWPQKGYDSRHSGLNIGEWKKFQPENEFSQDADYNYLKLMAESMDPGDKKEVVNEINLLLIDNPLGLKPYHIQILEYLATENIYAPITNKNIILNDFPSIRGDACRILSRVGDLYTIDILVNSLKYEWDPFVISQILFALGELGSDPDFTISMEISRIISRNNTDLRIAEAGISAFENLAAYNGPSMQIINGLLSIVSGDYTRLLREKALSVLRSIKK